MNKPVSTQYPRYLLPNGAETTVYAHMNSSALAIGYNSNVSAVNSSAIGFNSKSIVPGRIQLGSITTSEFNSLWAGSYEIFNASNGMINSSRYNAGSTVNAATPTTLGTVYGVTSSSTSSGLTLLGYNATGNDGQFSTIIGFNAGTSKIGGMFTDNAVAIGHNSIVSGTGVAVGAYANSINSHSVAIGYGATANGIYSTSVGSGSNSVGNSVAVGFHAQATVGSVVVGAQDLFGATDTGSYTVAIGHLTNTVNSSRSIAIGYNARAVYDNSVALGYNARSLLTGRIQLGSNDHSDLYFKSYGLVESNGMINTARYLGAAPATNTTYGTVYGNTTNNTNSVSLGYGSIGGSPNSVSIGSNSSATNNSVSLGHGAVAGAFGTNGGISIGCNSNTMHSTIYTSYGIAIGFNSKAQANRAIALGVGTNASYENAIAIGPNTTAHSFNSISIRGYLDTNSANGISIGGSRLANSNWSISIGDSSWVTNATNSVAIGYRANVYCAGDGYAVAIGYDTNVYNMFGVAIGAGAKANGQAVALGPDARANYANSVSIGASAMVNASNRMFLGNSSRITSIYAATAITSMSDRRDKTSIINNPLGLNFINKLRPVQYRWNHRDKYINNIERDITVLREVIDPETGVKTVEEVVEKVLEPDCGYIDTIDKDGNPTKYVNLAYYDENDGSKSGKRIHNGLIAQEVKEVADQLGIDFAGYQESNFYGDGEDRVGLVYEEFISPIIKSIQDLSRLVVDQQSQINELKLKLGIDIEIKD